MPDKVKALELDSRLAANCGTSTLGSRLSKDALPCNIQFHSGLRRNETSGLDSLRSLRFRTRRVSDKR